MTENREEKILEKVTKRKELKKIIKTKKPRKVIKEIKYYAIYYGPHKHMSMSGIGRIIPGKEYKVSQHQANTLRFSIDWKIEEKFVYEEISS